MTGAKKRRLKPQRPGGPFRRILEERLGAYAAAAGAAGVGLLAGNQPGRTLS
jgi:hypothetical protein